MRDLTLISLLAPKLERMLRASMTKACFGSRDEGGMGFVYFFMVLRAQCLGWRRGRLERSLLVAEGLQNRLGNSGWRSLVRRA